MHKKKPDACRCRQNNGIHAPHYACPVRQHQHRFQDSQIGELLGAAISLQGKEHMVPWELVLQVAACNLNQSISSMPKVLWVEDHAKD